MKKFAVHILLASLFLCSAALAKPVVMVLPLRSQGRVSAADRWLGHGTATWWTARLAQRPELILVDRGSQLEVLKTLKIDPRTGINDSDAMRLAKLLGADWVLHGQFRADKKQLRIQAKLLGRDGTDLALDEVASTPTELFAGLEAVAKQVEQHLSLQSLPIPAGILTYETEALRQMSNCSEALATWIELSAVKQRTVRIRAKQRKACLAAARADSGLVEAQAAVLAIRLLAGEASARTEARRFVAKYPSNETALLALANAVYHHENDGEAMQMLERAAQRMPNSLRLLRIHGQLSLLADRYDLSTPVFARAVRLSPKNPFLQFRLSYGLYNLQKNDQALVHAREASRLTDGQSALYQNHLGERLLDATQFDAAIPVLSDVADRLKPDWATPRVRLAYALLHLDRPDEALAQLDRARRLKLNKKEKRGYMKALIEINRASALALKGDAQSCVDLLRSLRDEDMFEKVDLKANRRFYRRIESDPVFRDFIAGW